MRLIRIECRVNPSEHDPGALSAREPAHFVSAKGVAGVNTDADDVAGVDGCGSSSSSVSSVICGSPNSRGVAAASTYNQRGVMTPTPNAR